MDRHRGGGAGDRYGGGPGDRYGGSPQDPHPYRHRGPPPPRDDRHVSPNYNHGGGFPPRRPFDSPPPPRSFDSPRFPPDGNFRGADGQGGNFRNADGQGGNFRNVDGQGGNFRNVDGQAGNFGPGGGNFAAAGGGGGNFRNFDGHVGNLRDMDGQGGNLRDMDGQGGNFTAGGSGNLRDMDGRGGNFTPGGNMRDMDGQGGNFTSGGGNFRGVDGDGGSFPPRDSFRQSGGRGYGSEFEVPLSGRKREFPFDERRPSPDHFDGGSIAQKKSFNGGSFDKVNFEGGSLKKPSEGGNFAKLFVGSVPRTATEEDVRPLFQRHGQVLEVAFIKDKKTGLQSGCCFIKYATAEEADRAIRGLHNQFTLPGGVTPIQVRFADGERERLGALEYKLYVGSLNKHATQEEVRNIFSVYGRVEDAYLMRDEFKQSRGCGFVKFSSKDSAQAAMDALNGKFTMPGCEHPLIVRFADPKKPRPGESRSGTAVVQGPGVSPQFQSPGFRPTPNLGDTMQGSLPPNSWLPTSQQNMGPPSDMGLRGFGGQVPPGSGDRMGPLQDSRFGGFGDVSLPGMTTNSAPQSLPQNPSANQNVSPLQKPYESLPDISSSFQLQPQGSSSYPQPQTGSSGSSVGPLSQPIGQNLLVQGLQSQQLHGFNGQYPLPQVQTQPVVSSASTQALPNNNIPPHNFSVTANQYQVNGPQQMHQPLHQSPQLAQLLSQQTQTLQARLQSSQQAFNQVNQLHKELMQIQPSNQLLATQQQTAKPQSQWPASFPQAGSTASAPATKPLADVPAASSVSPAVPAIAPAAAPVKCNWTEHTSPDGFKYYHNSTTGESKWEKPEELTLFEQQQKLQQQQQPQLQKEQQQKVSMQQPQSQALPSTVPVHQVSQNPLHLQSQYQTLLQTQFQSQLPHAQQLQHVQPSMYQGPGVGAQQNNQQYQAPGVGVQQNNQQDYRYAQASVPANSVKDPANFQQQGHQGGQEFMWKNKPAGS